MAIGRATVPSGCFGESILRGGACMFEPASTSTTSSSKITGRLRHAVGRCAGSSRSPQLRSPWRGLSSRTAYVSGGLSVSPRIDGSTRASSRVVRGDHGLISAHALRLYSFPFGDVEFSTRVCNATSNPGVDAAAKITTVVRFPRQGGAMSTTRLLPRLLMCCCVFAGVPACTSLYLRGVPRERRDWGGQATYQIMASSYPPRR